MSINRYRSLEDFLGKLVGIVVLHVMLIIICGTNANGATINLVPIRNCTNSNLVNCTSTPVRNISQVQHTIIAKFSDSTESAGTCALGGSYEVAGVRLEGSMDNITYFTMVQATPLTTGLISSTHAYGSTNGSYPFVRIKVVPYTDCNVEVSYSGTTTPFPINNNSHLSGLRSVSGSTSSTAALLISPMATNYAARIVVYGVYLFNPSAAAKVVNVKEMDITGVSTLGTVVTLTKLPAARDVNIGFNTDIPLRLNASGSGLWLTQELSAGDVNPLGAIDYVILYKWE